MSTSAAAPVSLRLTPEQRAWQWRILISTYFAYAGYYLCRKVFSLCKTTLNDEFGWGMDSIAHLWTVYLIAYMAGQFISSYLGRSWGPRVLLLGGFGATILANIVFGFANSYWTFLIFMAFNGLVQATGWPGCVGGVAEWLRSRERGTIMGLWSTNYLVGNMMVKSLGGLLLGMYGWRYAFFGCTLLAFLFWWLLYFWQRNRPEDVGVAPIMDEPSEDRSVETSNDIHITLREYFSLLLNPVIPLMGLSYFCLKFLRYALDSWLPTFLNLQGMSVANAAYFSSTFDVAGLAGVFVSGYLLDRVFRGRWPALCLLMGIGMALGYYLVTQMGANPLMLSIAFGFVGFMLYGPDTILCGAAAVQVAGERNAIAVAGLINGLGSMGPVIQEEVIGWLMSGDDTAAGMHNTNLLALAMSVGFVAVMLLLTLQGRHGAAKGA